MILKNEIIKEIEKNLENALISSYKERSNASDVFEAFVLSIIIQAAIKEGAKCPIQWENINGAKTTNILFRRSPGYINSASPQYTHAILDFPGVDLLELHLGIYAIGIAEVPQECDIAVVKRSEAQRCRSITNGKVSIKSRHILIGVECKCYESSKISLGLGRSFLGLVKDFSSRGKLKSQYFFISNQTFKSVAKLLSRHDQAWAHDLTPTSDKEIEKLCNQFQSKFQQYKSSF